MANERLANIPTVLGLDKRGGGPESGKAERLDPLPGDEQITQTKEQQEALKAQQEALVNPRDQKELLEVDPEILTVDTKKLQERRAEGKKEAVKEEKVEDLDLGIPEDILPDELKQKKPEEKNPEGKSALDISDDVISKWEPKTQEAFKSMRIELKQAKEAIKASGEGKASPEMEKRFTEAQAALSEAHNTIARLNLAEDPRFKAKYNQQKDMLTAQLKHQAKQLEYDEGIVDVLKNLGLRERISYINEKAPMLKDVSMPLFTQLDMIDNAMKSELANAKSSMEHMSHIQSEQMKTLQGKVLSETVEQASKAGHFVFKKGENAEWNATVDAVTQKATDILSSGNFKLQTESILLGQAAPIYLDLFKRERAARMQIQQQLAKYTNGQSRITEPDATETQGITVPKNMKLDDLPRLMEAKRRARAAAQ